MGGGQAEPSRAGLQAGSCQRPPETSEQLLAESSKPLTLEVDLLTVLKITVPFSLPMPGWGRCWSLSSLEGSLCPEQGGEKEGISPFPGPGRDRKEEIHTQVRGEEG